MNKVIDKPVADSTVAPSGLALLRVPFPAHQISKLPKPTKAQTEAVRADYKSGIRCTICGTWHHQKVVHLDYVGHAALTDRLLDADLSWNWEPVSVAEDGTPAIDANGGMWIRLTVCGVTRLGYGHPDGKKGGDSIKEVIGDALRNAAMRFGAALDLWHKGDLHADDEPPPPEPKAAPARDFEREVADAIRGIEREKTLDGLAAFFGDLNRTARDVAGDPKVIAAKDARKAALRPIVDDEIPY